MGVQGPSGEAIAHRPPDRTGARAHATPRRLWAQPGNPRARRIPGTPASPSGNIGKPGGGRGPALGLERPGREQPPGPRREKLLEGTPAAGSGRGQRRRLCAHSSPRPAPAHGAAQNTHAPAPRAQSPDRRGCPALPWGPDWDAPTPDVAHILTPAVRTSLLGHQLPSGDVEDRVREGQEHPTGLAQPHYVTRNAMIQINETRLREGKPKDLSVPTP